MGTHNKVVGGRWWRTTGSALLLVVFAVAIWLALSTASLFGQTPGESSSAPTQEATGTRPPDQLPDQLADEALQPSSGGEQAAPAPAAPADKETSPNYLELAFSGGWLAAIIAAMSIVVVAVGVERCVALRRRRIIPQELSQSLSQAAENPEAFDLRRIQQQCAQYPSTLAAVLRAMLDKLGRPLVEVERAITDASEREAARLYSNVRTLNLAAAICPLLGLLGTVWGMIQAFFVTAHLPVGANKAEQLAAGIYLALVTTFAGLAVAIPAAVLAHLFEGRIQSLLLEIDDLLLGVLPHWERFEGRTARTKAESPPQRPTTNSNTEEHSRPATFAPK